jgi:hypothetical protein
MTDRPELDNWLLESARVLEEVFPADDCDDSFRIYGLNWLPGSAHRHNPPTTPLVVERQAGDGPTHPSPATQLANQLKRIALNKAKKTARNFRKGDPT